MAKKYEHLLSPYTIGNVIFRNRMTSGPNDVHFLQGPENYITDAMISWLANMARNGAAWVTYTRDPVPSGYKIDNLHPMYEGTKEMVNMPTWMTVKPEPVMTNKAHLSLSDVSDGNVQHYISQMTETIHFYGSKISTIEMRSAPPGYDVSEGIPGRSGFGAGSRPEENKEIPAEMLEQMVEDIANQMAVMQYLGHDMCYLHMSYRFSIMGRMLSAITNKRKDKYGGSVENRARFILMIAERIKQRCGKDFIIEASISGEDPPGGYTLDDAIAYAKMFEGYIDILQLRGPEIDPSNLYAFIPESDPTPTIHYAEAFKKSGVKLAIEPIGGFTNPDWAEEAIASGWADFVGMTRAWTSNPNLGTLVYEGKGEDVVPCIRCNKCHKSGYNDPWAPFCSVNPVFG